MAKRVLVVDDRGDTLGFVRLGLERAGYTVDVAESGSQALELQQRHAADVLITDIFMPDMDGIEIIDRIKAHYPHTRVIAMSGGGRTMADNYLHLASKVGADWVLAKPFSREDLAEAIAVVMDRA